jgi:hypothetical protein
VKKRRFIRLFLLMPILIQMANAQNIDRFTH